MAKLRGATVIGTKHSPKKAAIARAAGGNHEIACRDVDAGAKAIAITGSAPCPLAETGKAHSALEAHTAVQFA
jgi:threonine dehydrogenase-like Zn-dependent dehydrogenase